MSTLIGKKFELWTVYDYFGKKNGHFLLNVYCRCGKTSIVRKSDLKRGKSTSCGVCVLMKGYVIEYKSAHTRIYRARGYASEFKCIDCGSDAEQWSFNYKDPNPQQSGHGPYSLDPQFYDPRCKPCHKAFDKAQMIGSKP